MNHFELFGLPSQFQLDGSLLSSKFRELQKRFHPDNFATASERDRLMSVQKAAQINDAYQVLKHPISRAEYILAEQGMEIRGEQQTMQDPMFLMEQMELREELEDIADCLILNRRFLTSILRSAKCISSIWQALSKSLTMVFGLKPQTEFVN